MKDRDRVERPADGTQKGRYTQGKRQDRQLQEEQKPHSLAPNGTPSCAHLDLLFQVFSSSHEVLNLPREDIRAYG